MRPAAVRYLYAYVAGMVMDPQRVDTFGIQENMSASISAWRHAFPSPGFNGIVSLRKELP